jgi:hypothetical protein
MDDIQPEEFIAEENLNYKEKETSKDEGVSKDDKTIITSNLPAPATAEETPSDFIFAVLRRRMSKLRLLLPTIKLN